MCCKNFWQNSVVLITGIKKKKKSTWHTCIHNSLSAGNGTKGTRFHFQMLNVSIFRFCYLQTCGCVFSDRALKEVKTEICHKVRNISSFFFSATLFQLSLIHHGLPLMIAFINFTNRCLIFPSTKPLHLWTIDVWQWFCFSHTDISHC